MIIRVKINSARLSWARNRLTVRADNTARAEEAITWNIDRKHADELDPRLVMPRDVVNLVETARIYERVDYPATRDWH